MFEQMMSFVARRKLFRQTLEELNSLNDRELGDLAIARHDIARVAREAVWGAQPAVAAPASVAAGMIADKPALNRRAFA